MNDIIDINAQRAWIVNLRVRAPQLAVEEVKDI
jgi:hypothetical protein